MIDVSGLKSFQAISCHWYLSTSPENIWKPDVFWYLQGVSVPYPDVIWNRLNGMGAQTLIIMLHLSSQKRDYLQVRTIMLRTDKGHPKLYHKFFVTDSKVAILIFTKYRLFCFVQSVIIFIIQMPKKSSQTPKSYAVFGGVLLHSIKRKNIYYWKKKWKIFHGICFWLQNWLRLLLH